MSKNFRRSAVALVLATTMLLSSQGVFTAFAVGENETSTAVDVLALEPSQITEGTDVADESGDISETETPEVTEPCDKTEGCTLSKDHEGECQVTPVDPPVENENGEGETQPCDKTEGCTLPNGHEGECVTEPVTPPEEENGEAETYPCEKTEGCTFPNGHEGECVVEENTEDTEDTQEPSEEDIAAAVQAVVDRINSLPTTDDLANYTPTIELNPEDEGYQEAYQAALDAYYSQIQEQVKAARAAYDALTEEQKAAFDATILAKLESLENLFAMREQINILPEGESDYTVTQDGNTFTTSEGIKIIYQFTDYLTGKDLTNDPAFADTKAFVDEGFLQFPELNGRALNNNREPDGPKFIIPAAYNDNKEDQTFFNFTYENDSRETIHRILRDVHYQFEGGGNGSSNTTTGIMPNPPMAPSLFDSTNGATLTVNYVFRNEGDPNLQNDILTNEKYSLQGTTQGNGLTGGLPPVRFSM